jgi:threonylcarbamoyladenosine tRNA methylthiotransferase MtaB
MDFTRVHVFPYSVRAGTAAASLPLQVHDHVKDSRANAMQRVATESAKRFSSKLQGRTLPVLYEMEGKVPGTWSGYTGNYVRVIARSEENLANRILPTRIDRTGEDGAAGSIEPIARHH